MLRQGAVQIIMSLALVLSAPVAAELCGGLPHNWVQVGRSRISKRTPSATWSQSGWNAFRWGMGPHDVEDRLRSKKGEFRSQNERALADCCTMGSSAVFTCEADDLAFTLLGVGPSLRFTFIDDRLAKVSLLMVSAPASSDHPLLTAAEGELLFTRLRELLVHEHGSPRYDVDRTRPARSDKEREFNILWVEWSEPLSYPERPPSRGFEIKLETTLIVDPADHFHPGGLGSVTVEYSEEWFESHLRGRLQGGPPASEAFKLRGVSPQR